MSLWVLILVLAAISALLYFLPKVEFLKPLAWLIQIVLIVIAIYVVCEFFGVIDVLRGIHGPRK